MRIGIVSNSYFPRYGGAVTQTNLLYDELLKRGHNLEIFCPDLHTNGRCIEEGRIVNRVCSRYIKDYYSFFSRLAILRGLRQTIRAKRAEFDVWFSPEFNLGPLALCLTPGITRTAAYGANLTFEYLNSDSTTPMISNEDAVCPSIKVLGPIKYLQGILLNRLQQFMFQKMQAIITLNDEDDARIARHNKHARQIPCLIR